MLSRSLITPIPNDNDSSLLKNKLFNNNIIHQSYLDTDINTTNQLRDSTSVKAQKEKIFSILKTNKKGRKRKLAKKIGTHTKFANDNIYRKVKVKFFEKILKYLNYLLSNQKFKIRLFKRIGGKIAFNAGYKFNTNLLKRKLKDIFSNDIDAKFTKITKKYNKNLILLIYKKNIKSVTKVLNWTFLKGLQIFRDNKKIQKYKGFEGLDVVLKELQEEGNDKENKNYIKKFENASKNFENYYGNK